MASVCACVCLLICMGPECTANPFKCLLIRPSMNFLLSRSVLFRSTPNYFNPLIAQRAPSPSIYRDRRCCGKRCACGKCGHVCRHWGLITGPSGPPGLFSSGLPRAPVGVTAPKIRCQGIFCALVSIPASPLPDCSLGLLCGLEEGIIYLPRQST